MTAQRSDFGDLVYPTDCCGRIARMREWRPSFSVSERDGRCWLSLDGIAQGAGQTLQEAAGDLVARLVAISMSVSEITWSTSLGRPDPNQLTFLWELRAVAAGPHDVRDWLFGRESERVR